MCIQYQINAPVSTDQFVSILNCSGLGERRPIDDRECLQGMLDNSNLVISAWKKETLIGIARSMTDFHYACYLSDLAVHRDYQSFGIGKEMQNLTLKQLGPRCKLILLAAPNANEYYPKVGYRNNPRAWVINSDQKVR